MTLGVIGTKLGMTQIYDETGLCIPVTVVAVEKAVVTQVKTKELTRDSRSVERKKPGQPKARRRFQFSKR